MKVPDVDSSILINSEKIPYRADKETKDVVDQKTELDTTDEKIGRIDKRDKPCL
jgi:hypothetical protein